MLRVQVCVNMDGFLGPNSLSKSPFLADFLNMDG